MRVCASLSSVSELDTPTRLVEIRLDLLGSVPEDPKGHEMLVTFRGPVDTGVLPEGFSGMIDIGEEHRPETSATVVASHHDFEGTPTAERSRPAPATSVEAASEMIPPTTGSAAEMAVLAARLAAASAAPASAPESESQSVKAVMTAAAAVTASHFMSLPALSSAGLSRADAAVLTASSA